MNRLITGTLILVAAMTLAACTVTGPAITGDNPSSAITGTLNYAEPIALADGARAHVALIDGSAAVLAEQVINIRGQTPVPFSIAYDPAVVDRGAGLALTAELLLADGSTGWRSAQPVPVFGGQPSTGLDLLLAVAGAADSKRSYRLTCAEFAGHFNVGDGRGTLLLSARSVSLPQVPSQDGDLYQAGDVRLWHDGRRAELQVAGARHSACAMVPITN